MAKINNYRKISTDGYPPESQQMIDTLASSLNPFMREVTDAINGDIDFDNLTQSITTLEVILNAEGVPRTVQFNAGRSNVNGFSVINVQNITNPKSYPTGQPFISFTPTGSNVININNISNLPANDKILLTIIIY